MKYTKELALLEEKAELLKHLYQRREMFEESMQEELEKVTENPDEKWRFGYIDEYSDKSSAISDLIKLIIK